MCPEIAPNCWKAALSFFWWREYRDGRQEQEFDLLTGQISPWGPKTPDGLAKVGWLPVTPGLAQKMKSCGEYGIPTQSLAVILPLAEDEEPVIYKETTVWEGSQVHCKACDAVFRSRGPATHCPVCGAKTSWRCPKCGQLQDSEICPDCKVQGNPINPLESRPARWDETEYFIGVKGKFCNRFNTSRLITEH